MISRKYVLATGANLVIAALLVACASTAAAPTATAVPPTPTTVPSTSTSTPVPATATPLPDTPVPASPSQASTGKVTIESGEITSQALAGNLLGDPNTRTFNVILPPGYATSGKRYPVVYVLHGYHELPTHMVGPFKRAYDAAVINGDVQEIIFVFPDANNTFRGSQYLSSPTIGDYETYLTQELVAHIDATYRTLPDRVSRGITGCSMGGDGSMGLGLKHPNVFGVAAPASGTYDYSGDTFLASATEYLNSPPEDLSDLTRTPWQTVYLLSWAAAAAANPEKPPFYLDMPVAVVNGEAQIVPEVVDKMIAVDPVHDLEHYLSQPERLDGILIYHGIDDRLVPVELARNFDQQLTDLGIDHEYLEVNADHCDDANFTYDPVVKFMSDNLVGEE